MFTPTPLQVILFVAKSVFPVGMSLALVGFIWALWEAFQKGWAYVRRLHPVPCDRCSFSTGEYNLKCAIHPRKALNEAAIDCPDYKPLVMSFSQVNR